MPSCRPRPRVVLVKDQSFLRSIIEKWLTPECDLTIFSDSEGALAYISSLSELSFLIAGLNLRDSAVGGCSIAREVRRRFPSVPILILEWGSETDHRNFLLREMPQVMRIRNLFDLWFRRNEILSLIRAQERSSLEG